MSWLREVTPFGGVSSTNLWLVGFHSYTNLGLFAYKVKSEQVWLLIKQFEGKLWYSPLLWTPLLYMYYYVILKNILLPNYRRCPVPIRWNLTNSQKNHFKCEHLGFSINMSSLDFLGKWKWVSSFWCLFFGQIASQMYIDFSCGFFTMTMGGKKERGCVLYIEIVAINNNYLHSLLPISLQRDVIYLPIQNRSIIL